MIIETSDAINEFAAALSKAQGAMSNAAKTAQNPHFKRTYADLASVREAVLPHLAANGIAVLQPVSAPAEGGAVQVTTMLVHSSGQWMRSTLRLPLDMQGRNAAQAAGSAISYARRYMLAGICCIASEDDDGEAIGGKPAPAPAPVMRTLDEGVQAALRAIEACETVEALEKLGSERLKKSALEIQLAVTTAYTERLKALKAKGAA